jgi:hypothetical protein
MSGMMRVVAACLCLAPLAAYAAGPATTQPTRITLHVRDMGTKALLAELAKQSGARMALAPPDLLEKNSIPPATLDLDQAPFWSALEQVSRKTGLEPVFSTEDPYPRFQLGLGGGSFWDEPHVVAGPVIVFADDVERTNVVELGRTKHHFDREMVVNLMAVVEPGVRALYASPRVKVKQAVDENGRTLTPPPEDPSDAIDEEGAASGLFAWNLAVMLEARPDGASRKIARLKGQTSLRVQTAEQRIEIDNIMKARNVVKVANGAPVTVRSLKKADIEYILQLNLRREKTTAAAWRDLHYSIYGGQMALYDEQGRLVASRATENGGDYGQTKIDATLRFVREPGISDPQAGEPFKLVWLAPTAGVDVPINFELTDLPIPE